MAKIRKNKKRFLVLHTSNIVSITLCVITAGLLIATCFSTYYANKQQSKNILDLNKLLVQFSNEEDLSTEEALEEIYLSYYNDIDQKATDSINIALSFFGFIFSLITIVNTVIAISIPKQFENSLLEIDDRMRAVEISARESTNAARFIDSLSSKKTSREKIDAITAVIEEYGDNSGEFYFARGFLYDDIKDYDNAKADYIRARKAGGAESVYHNSMGVLYSNIMNASTNIEAKKSAFKKSEKHYNKAITLLEKEEEKTDYCHCNLACLYQDYAKELKGLAALEKNSSKAFSNGEHSQSFQMYFELALEEFNKTILMSDDYLTAFFNRGISYREMGEDYYENAYDDFLTCYEIDPENKDVWDVLFKTALTLFQKTKNKQYYDVAKICIKNLREDVDTIELLTRKFVALESLEEAINNLKTNELLAKIDEKIADLSLEEAQEHIDDPTEYGKSISDAIEHYNLSLTMYKQLYSINSSQEYLSGIQRVQNKMDNLRKPE